MNILERQQALQDISDRNSTRRYKSINERDRLANTVLFIVTVAMFLLSAFGFAMSMKQDKAMSIVRLVLVFLCLLPIIITFIKDRTSDSFSTLTLSIFTGFYLLMQLLFSSPVFGLYIFPVVIAAMIYSNPALVRTYCLIASIGMGLQVTKYYENIPEMGRMAKMSAIMIIALFVICKITEWLNEFNKDIQGDIIDERAKQDIIMEEQLSLSLAVKKDTEKIGTFMDDLDSANNNVSETMDSMIDGVTNITTTIQEQKQMTDNIQVSIENTKQKAENIKTAAKVSRETVSENLQKVTELKDQSEEISSISHSVADQMVELQKKMEDVSKITLLITGIANQTNLLSLNAMIEAAHAGDAGKGFAVVADEIRSLSEKTKKASSDIEKTLKDLKIFANETVKSVSKSIENTESECQNIEAVYEGFGVIDQKMDDLSAEIDQLKDTMDKLATDNDVIVDGITQLSAVSEQINASADNATSSVKGNAGNFRYMKAKYGTILDKVKRFGKYLHE